MKSSIKNKLIFGMAWSIIDKLVTQVGYLVVTLFIAKYIGPEAFGLIGMLSIFMLLAESIVNNGFSQALVQRSHQATDDDYSTIFYVNLLWGLFIYIGLFFLAPWIAEFYNKPELIDISRLLFLVVLINCFSVVIRAQLIIKVDFKSQAISGFMATIFSSSIAIYLVLNGYGYWAFVYLILLKALFSNIFLWYFSRWIPKLVFSKESFNSLFKFGSNLMLAGFVATLVNNLYIALIGKYFNASSVGYFTQATNLTNFLSQFISSTLQGVTYPVLTSLKEQKEKLVSLYKQLITITMLVSLPILIGFSAIADTFVKIFLGEEWMSTVPIIQTLCFARAITPISVINMNILNAIGRSDLFLKVDLSKLPMTLVALLIALPYGVQAVAFSILITTSISFFINAYYPGKLFKFGAWDQLMCSKNYIISSISMFIIIKLISIEDLWIDLLLKICLGVFLYFVILLLLRDNLLMLSIKKIKFKYIK